MMDIFLKVLSYCAIGVGWIVLGTLAIVCIVESFKFLSKLYDIVYGYDTELRKVNTNIDLLKELQTELSKELAKKHKT